MTPRPIRIKTLNAYALQTIELAHVPSSHLVWFLPFPIYAYSPTRKLVVETFLLTVDSTNDRMLSLREEIEGWKKYLICPEEHLCKMVNQENQEQAGEQDGTAVKHFAWLGGEKRMLEKAVLLFDVLKNSDEIRQQALGRLVAMVQALNTLNAKLEELRWKTAFPDVTRDRIPPEAHVKSIKAGIGKLRRLEYLISEVVSIED